MIPMCSDDFEPQQTWTNNIWRPEDKVKPAPQDPCLERIHRPEVLQTIEERIHELSEELRALSLDIHGRWLLVFSHRSC